LATQSDSTLATTSPGSIGESDPGVTMRETYQVMRLWGGSRFQAARLAWTVGRKLKRNDPLLITDTWGRTLSPSRVAYRPRPPASPPGR
jgi:hypothetical protein